MTLPNEALEAAAAAWDADLDHRRQAEASLEAAYPLIRAQVCQELAEALREKARTDGRFDSCFVFAAEFVEQFGADRGGENV